MRKLNLSLTTYLLTGLVILSTALRFYHLGTQSMWEDEITRTLNATHYAKSLLHVVELASSQSQPPLSYWVTRIFYNFSSFLHLEWSDNLARFPFAVFGVAAIPMLFFTAKEWFGEQTAWIAATLLAISPLHIRYSQEVGPYSLWVLVMIIESYFIVRALRSGKFSDWFLTILFMILAVYTHAFSAFMIALQVAAIGFVVLLLNKLRTNPENTTLNIFDFIYSIIAAAITALSFLPLLKNILSGSDVFMQGLKMSIIDYSLLILSSFSPYFLTEQFVSQCLIGGFLILSFLYVFRKYPFEGTLLAASVIGVAILEYIVFIKAGWRYFYPRYIIGVLPFYLITIALGMWLLADIFVKRLLRPSVNEPGVAQIQFGFISGLIIILFWGSSSSINDAYNSGKQDWRGLTHYVGEFMQTNDVISFTPDYYNHYYNYYLEKDYENRARYQNSSAHHGEIGSLYWVTGHKSHPPFIETTYGPLEQIKELSGGLVLWELRINQSLDEIPLLNRELMTFSTDTEPNQSAIGWNLPNDGQLRIIRVNGPVSNRAIELQFTLQDQRVAITSEAVSVVPGKAIYSEAIIRSENLGPLGATFSLEILDQEKNIITRYKSDPIVGTIDWLTFSAGGIVPDNGHEARINLYINNQSQTEGSIYLQDVHIYGDWSIPIPAMPLVQAELPKFEFGNQSKWWNVSPNSNIDLSFDPNNNLSGNPALKVTTTGPDVDYKISSPPLAIDTEPGSRFVFQAFVKTSELSGPQGMRIAVGWRGTTGKTIQWSESNRLIGTNDWQLLRIAGYVPEQAEYLVLIPLRLFDSVSAGETVWIDKVQFFIEGLLYSQEDSQVDITSGLALVELPNLDFRFQEDVGVSSSWWNIPSNKLIMTSLGPGHENADQLSLRLTTTGPGADYMVSSPQLSIDAEAGSQFVFQTWVKTMSLSGPKGMEIAVGWKDASGKTFRWSESSLIQGTNDWQLLQVIGSVPEGTRSAVLVSLRLFDSKSAGESVWIDGIQFFVEPGVVIKPYSGSNQD